MNITTGLNPLVSWRAFSRGIPKVMESQFPEEASLPQVEVELSLQDGVLSASPPGLLVPALQKLFGDNPKERLHGELNGATLLFSGKEYRLGYVNDMGECEYGWYIVEKTPA